MTYHAIETLVGSRRRYQYQNLIEWSPWFGILLEQEDHMPSFLVLLGVLSGKNIDPSNGGKASLKAFRMI